MYQEEQPLLISSLYPWSYSQGINLINVNSFPMMNKGKEEGETHANALINIPVILSEKLDI